MKKAPQLVEKYNNKISKMKNVEFIFMSRDEEVSNAEAWAKKASFPWPTILLADEGKTILKDKIKMVPAYALLDKDGKILAQDDDSVSVMEKLEELNK